MAKAKMRDRMSIDVLSVARLLIDVASRRALITYHDVLLVLGESDSPDTQRKLWEHLDKLLHTCEALRLPLLSSIAAHKTMEPDQRYWDAHRQATGFGPTSPVQKLVIWREEVNDCYDEHDWQPLLSHLSQKAKPLLRRA